MKKLIFLFCLSLNCCTLFAQYEFKVNGKTPATFNNKKIFLVLQDAYSKNKFKSIDSTVIRNKAFSFGGTLTKPSEWGYLQLKGGTFYFVIDTGNNLVTIDPVTPGSPHYKNSLSNTSVTGSQSNVIEQQLRELRAKFHTTYGKASKTNKGIIELSKEKYNEMMREHVRVVQENPDAYYSLISLYKLFYELNLNLELKKQAFESLNEHIRNTPLGMELFQRFEDAMSIRIGNPVRTFNIPTDEGYLFSSNSMKGKTYLIAFGATWCAPCKKNIPVLKNLYEKYKEHGFEVVAVNLDDKEVKWKEQIAAFKLQWINVSERKDLEESQMAARFNVTAVPLYLLVDKEGTIIYNSFQLKDYEIKDLESYISKSVH